MVPQAEPRMMSSKGMMILTGWIVVVQALPQVPGALGHGRRLMRPLSR